MTNILDNFAEIKKLDSQNMLSSIEKLGNQAAQVYEVAQKIKIPLAYGKVANIVVAGMGGSALGAHLIHSLFQNELKVPLSIVNDYHLPKSVGAHTLVVVSSYSGNTEEALSALKDAIKQKAKTFIICSGGALKDFAEASKIPALILPVDNNPCGSPRMGLGYSIFGQIAILSKLKLIKFTDAHLEKTLSAIKLFQEQFGAHVPLSLNPAKNLAENILGKSGWFVGSGHLSGSAHVAANQLNENSKRFGGYFLMPELNHHLMEGLPHPHCNIEELIFVLFESGLYEDKIKKRFEVTKEILAKNRIHHISYVARARTPLEQVCEVLLLSSYVSFYCAIAEGIDPTAIPFVDYFKSQLSK